ncbi:MAG: ABC transporter substrate-binding protein [Rhodospirillaceae bacterium]|nr:ABC transporter substrate-binding protein [Rhodospirillaceae bacterium]MBT5457183.1 ABC transporter substrate-binding protein [Rhodospirillaceae bacterium]
MRYGLFFLVVFLVTAGSGAPLQAAPNYEKAREFILTGVARTIEQLKVQGLPRPEIAKRLRRELRSGFDVPTIAGFVLGPLRRRITKDQKRRYLHEFEELIVLTYTNRVFNVQPRIKTISPDIIRVTGSTPIGSDQLLVKSEVNRSGIKWVKIDWRLRERDGRLLIIDIIILGISQAQVYRSEFASVLRRNGGGIEGLIAALIRKNHVLRAKK